MIEVTFIEAGKTQQMTRQEFYEYFGKDEGEEILAGNLPQVVAIEIAPAA